MRNIFLIALMSVFAQLTACGAVTATPAYHPPYTQEQLLEAAEIVQSITYLEWFDTQTVCGKSHTGKYGCTSSDGHIVICKCLSPESRMELYWHELGHLYEIHILEVPFELSRIHFNWDPSPLQRLYSQRF